MIAVNIDDYAEKRWLISRDVFVERKRLRDAQIESVRLKFEDLSLVIQKSGDAPSLEKVNNQTQHAGSGTERTFSNYPSVGSY